MSITYLTGAPLSDGATIFAPDSVTTATPSKHTYIPFIAVLHTKYCIYILKKKINNDIL